MIHRIFIYTVIAFLFVLAPLTASAIEGFPGSTWGELRQELPIHNGEENLILQGWIEQGIDWHHWGSVKLNTYATLRYNWDSEGLDWNNSIGPGIGIALNRITPAGNQIRFGAEFITERFWKTDRTEEKAIIFVKWFQYWDLKKKRE